MFGISCTFTIFEHGDSIVGLGISVAGAISMWHMWGVAAFAVQGVIILHFDIFAGANVTEEEIRIAEDKFEESKQLTEAAMFNLLENDVS